MKDKTFTLDEHDFKLIRAFKWQNKDNPCTLDKLAKIWNERVGYDYETSQAIHYISSYLLSLAHDLNLLDSSYRFNDFILRLTPENNYYFTCISRPYLTNETTDFNLILLSRLDSLFSLTDVKRLPGYSEFHHKELEKEKN